MPKSCSSDNSRAELYYKNNIRERLQSVAVGMSFILLLYTFHMLMLTAGCGLWCHLMLAGSSGAATTSMTVPGSVVAGTPAMSGTATKCSEDVTQ